MMITVKQLKDYIGETISLRGWISRKRSSGKIQFIQLRSAGSFIQIICLKEQLGEECFAKIKKAPVESPIIVTGKALLPPGRSEIEIHLESIKIFKSSSDYPISKKTHGPEFLLEHRHLWIRSQIQTKILKIRSSLEYACICFLQQEGFYRMDAPIFTPSACEGTTDLFEVDYFGSKAFLSQSGQLYSEAGISCLEKVYTFGPCFRAEKSKTRRHLTEFWGVEPEVAWLDAEENIILQERFIKFILSKVVKECADELISLGRDPESLIFDNQSFPVLLYDEALEIVKKGGFEMQWGEDFRVEQEEYLSSQFATPFFIFKYPVQCRAFYIEPAPDQSELALSSDCLMPGGFGEIITGGQRTASYDFLLQRIQEHGLSQQDFQWYLDLRKFGSVPHSGFGMGIERMTRWLTGVKHIRETIPFPRTLKRFSP
ncbi:MAG: asparagine--tRNA ligase [Spirochaetes bacterium]|nr:asparagine--tRNA ligase [Spirochaetota bacterium]